MLLKFDFTGLPTLREALPVDQRVRALPPRTSLARRPMCHKLQGRRRGIRKLGGFSFGKLPLRNQSAERVAIGPIESSVVDGELFRPVNLGDH